jgi:hypothetical protein
LQFSVFPIIFVFNVNEAECILCNGIINSSINC